MREYQFAKQNGFQGSFQDWITAGGQSSRPSAVSEYEYYKSLPEPAKAEYLRVKRADQMANLGGSVMFRAPSGAVSAEYQKTLPPEDLPQTKGAQAEASAIGTATGTVKGAQNKQRVLAPRTLDLLDQAESLLPQSTGSGVGDVADKAAAVIGKSTEGAEAGDQLKMISANLTLQIPRMEGPQSDRDTQLYKQAAADLGNTALPVARRMAALKRLRGLTLYYTKHDITQPEGDGGGSDIDSLLRKYIK